MSLWGPPYSMRAIHYVPLGSPIHYVPLGPFGYGSAE